MPKQSQWVARYLAPTLLITVACAQLLLSHTLHLDPWKGGGFGMFATLDGKTERAFSCVVKDAEGQKYIVSLEDSYEEPRSKIERVFRKLLKKNYTLPTDFHLRDLAEVILSVPIVAKERFDFRDIHWLEEDAAGGDLTLPSWIDKTTRIYRLADRRDLDDEDIQKIYPRQVDVKVLRLQFDTQENKMIWSIVNNLELKREDL